MSDILTSPHPTAATADRPIGRSSDRAIPAVGTSGVHVLVADADATTRSAREQQLLAAGHRVSLARTAFEALVKATCQQPDVILLDGSLPDIGTHDTIQFLSTCPVTAHIPVARLTRGRGVPQRIMGELRRRSS
jgi:DNA-binding NtrC family response regulator